MQTPGVKSAGGKRVKNRDGDWNHFGWEGVAFLKPSEWDLSFVEGDVNKGYASLDDGLRSRLQLRWHKADSELDVEKVASRQAKIISKKSRNSLSEARISDYSFKTFKGKKFEFDSEGAKTFYYILQCRDCLQVILLGFFGDRGEDIERECEKIVRSLRDHGRGGKILWAVFGFSFHAPVDFQLKKYQLRSGDLTFEFAREKDLYFFHRISLAKVHLRDVTLTRWVSDFIGSKYANAEIANIYEDPVSHEKGVSVKGREKGRLKLFKKRFLNAHFWVCEQRNDIMGVTEFNKGAGSTMEELVRGGNCH